MNNSSAPSIKNVIIPVGGYGTRMFPLTQAIPKALLPLGDKPLLFHAVDEALRSGAQKILIPCRPDEYNLFSHQFHVDDRVIEKIKQTGRENLLTQVTDYPDRVKLIPVYEKSGPAGSIAKVLREEEIDEAFGIILPDDIIISDPPALLQVMKCFEKSGLTSVGTRHADLTCEKAPNGTFIRAEKMPCGNCIADHVQIKPASDLPVSEQATCGRYVFGPDFAQMVNETPKDDLAELSMSAVVRHIAEQSEVLVCHMPNIQYFDCGDHMEYFRANAAFMPKNVLQDAFNAPSATHESAPNRHIEKRDP